MLAGVVSLAVCASASAAPIATFSNQQPIAIPVFGNASPYGSPIVVSGLAGSTTSVNVTVRGQSHARVNDIGIVLVGPTGAALLLQDAAGGSSGLSDVTTIFSDSGGASPLPNSGAWPSGSYKPTAYAAESFPAPGPGTAYGNPGPVGGGTATFASTFDSLNPNGTWRLYARDFVASNSGSIAGGWTLQLQTSIGDVQEPQTTIESGPSAVIASSSASFSFSADEFATFECSLDSAAFSACTSPKSYSSLSDGPHTVAVRATDPTANVDPTPATTTFTVDTVAPETTIDLGPSGTIAGPTTSFAFSASETASFECKLDSAAFAACTSPQEYAGLADGQHTFQLRATDAAGNVDRTGASRTFTVGDTGVPILTVDKPRPRRGQRKAVVTFGAIDDRTSIGAISYTCALDGGAPAACTSPVTYRRLAFGKHNVTVVASDLAGNTSAPATARFKIKRRN